MAPRRCSWLNSNGSPCRRLGVGNPPLCDQHEAAAGATGGFDPQEFVENPIHAVRDAFLEHPKIQGFFDKLGNILDSGVEYIDRASKGNVPRARAQRPQPPQAKGPDPRQVLNFGPHEHLTVAVIKERKKLLARLYHPDLKGSAEAMARVNAAADRLLASLK